MLSSPNDESPANIEAAVSALIIYCLFIFFIFSLRLLGTSDGVKIVPFAFAFVAMLKISTSIFLYPRLWLRVWIENLFFSCGTDNFLVFNVSIIEQIVCVSDKICSDFCLQKDWRENRDEFKKKVRRLVRKSQEML
jgi:hypothetical protein